MRNRRQGFKLDVVRAVAIMWMALVLAGCGGGSSAGSAGQAAEASPEVTTSTVTTVTTVAGTTTTTNAALVPAAPTLTLTPQNTRTFHFTWADVAGETQYRLLEKADAASSYVQVATIAANTTAYDHAVFLPSRVNASYILQACNAGGCADSAAVAVVSGSLAFATEYVKASNTGAFDSFGISVALAADGNTLAIGGHFEASSATGVNGDQASNAAPASGAVYVFTKSGGVWTQQAYLKASNTAISDFFGMYIALSADGDTLAVSAYGEDSNATGINGAQNNDLSDMSGAVYVFSRSSGTWSQQAYVKASNTEASDLFGYGIALAADGNTLAVGAIYEDSAATGINGNQADNTAANSGAVYVFTRSGGAWSQQAYVKASNTEANDNFGISVALSADGSTLAVGARSEAGGVAGINGNQADNTATQSGAVYVFTRSGGTWSQQAYVKASNPGVADWFGISVALSADGNTLAVGAVYEDSVATGINGNQADNTVANSGAAYVFTRSGSAWSQQAYVKASNPGANDYFGRSVTLSSDGNTLAVGAPGESSSSTGINGNQADNTAVNSGAAYVFTRSGGAWSQQAYVKASNAEAGDQFGYAIALAGNGATLAVGAYYERSSATGINGNQADNSAESSGAVYLY